jgi:hypothetical protein
LEVTLNHPTILCRGVSGRGRSIAIAAAATLALSLPVAAQEAAESAEPAAESAEPAAESAGIAFPVMLGGQLLTPQTYDGAAWLARFAEGDSADPAFVAGTEALVESAGATVDDLTVKTAMYEPAPGEAAVVAALRIDGTDAREWVELAVDVMVPDVAEPGLVIRPLDTKWTLRVTDASMPGVYPRTVYLKDDTAWFIQGDNDYVWDALGQLPDADPPGLSAADSLYTDMPLSLGGVRRFGLYETTEPLFLPTLGERLGTSAEEWLLRAFLEAGISPADMLGVITWWGLEGAQDGIQIEGYRLPEGGEELTASLLEDVFLIRPPEVSVDPNAPTEEPIDEVAAMLTGVSFSEEEIAGQPVTALDFGGSRQYIYSSADTIWVISDPLGQPELVEEAISTLP